MTLADILALIGIKLPDNNIKKITAKDVRDSFALIGSLFADKADLVGGIVPLNQLPSIGLQVVEAIISGADLAVGTKTINHGLNSEKYLIKFTDKITKEEIKVRNLPNGVDEIKVINDIPFVNEVDVLIIKIN